MLNTKKYFLSLFLLLLALTLPAVLIIKNNFFDWFLAIPCFFLVLGIAFYISMNRLTKSTRKSSFVNYYMVTLFSKFFVSIIFIVLYLLFIKEQILIFIVSFFIYYIVFSVFETNMFLQLNKKSVSEKK